MRRNTQKRLSMDWMACPSFEKCVFCLQELTDELTKEHIVPEAISGEGQKYIIRGSCRKCNSKMNTEFENESLQKTFLLIRQKLNLRRKKKKKPQKLPPKVVINSPKNFDDIVNDNFITQLEASQLPSVFTFFMPSSAGYLTNRDCKDGFENFRIIFLNLSQHLPVKYGYSKIIQQSTESLGIIELFVAKMAYTYFIARKKINYMQDFCDDRTDKIRNILNGNRKDIWNFVGEVLNEEKMPMTKQLHKFYLRKRNRYETVIVHLFASFEGPAYEVVVAENI